MERGKGTINVLDCNINYGATANRRTKIRPFNPILPLYG